MGDELHTLDDVAESEEPREADLLAIEQEGSEEEIDHNISDGKTSAQWWLLKRSKEPPSAFNIYFGELYKGHLLSAQQERILMQKKENGDAASREELIVCSLRLVVKIAKKYAKKGVQFLDLIQEGNIGLIKGVDRFKSDRGFRLSTYAAWWMRQSMVRAVSNQSRTIRVSINMESFLVRRRKTIKSLIGSLGRVPEREEIIEHIYQEDMCSEQIKTGMPFSDASAIRILTKVKKRVRQAEAIEAREQAISLERLLEEDADDTVLGVFEDEQCDLEMAIQHSQQIEGILNLLKTLTESEQEVINLRFGIKGDEDPLTLEAITFRKGVSRERVRQIEAKGLEKIRERCRIMGY